MRRRVIALLSVVIVLAPGVAHAAQNQTVRPPTLLWKAYPLEQRPAANRKTPAVPAAPAARSAPRRPQPATVETGQTGHSVRQAAPQASAESTQLRTTLLLAVVVAMAAAAMVLVLTRTSVPARVGGGRPARRRPRQAAPSRTTAAQPGDDLLEALRPVPERAPAPVEPDPPPPSEAVYEAPGRGEPVLTAQACEIRLWRGFAKCRLYAAAAGSEEAVVASPYFRLRDEHTATPEAERALAGILAQLERDGWSVVSDGPTWYACRLERVDA